MRPVFVRRGVIGRFGVATLPLSVGRSRDLLLEGRLWGPVTSDTVVDLLDVRSSAEAGGGLPLGSGTRKLSFRPAARTSCGDGRRTFASNRFPIESIISSIDTTYASLRISEAITCPQTRLLLSSTTHEPESPGSIRGPKQLNQQRLHKPSHRAQSTFVSSQTALT
jgi:hypothetical protein